MKPVIEDTKIDKIVQENFENIRTALCGNLSLDNMSIRILEGTTDTISDTLKQFNHSGNSRPVGWFPLVGDVYIQEITDKYLDIRSTKPDVNFKILIIFGQPITQESLKAIGGDGYKNTTQVIETTEVTEVQTVVDQTIKMVPTIAHGAALENPTNANCDLPLADIHHMVNDGTYLYLTEANVGGNYSRNIRRINLDTYVVDLLFINAATTLGAMALSGTILYVIEQSSIGGTTVNIYNVDTATFTLSGTITGTSDNIVRIADLHFDSIANIFYFTGTNALASAERLLKMPLAGGAFSITALSVGAAGTSRQAKQLLPVGTDTLYIVGDNTDTNVSNIYKVSKATFTVTTTYTTTAQRWRLASGAYYEGYILMPVMYTASKTLAVASAGTVPFGMLALDTVAGTFSISPAPMFMNVSGIWENNIVVSDDDYAYMCQSDENGVTAICRFDLIDLVWEIGAFPFSSVSTAASQSKLQNCLHKMPDGSIWFFSNSIGQHRCIQAFEIDFSQYIREE